MAICRRNGHLGRSPGGHLMCSSDCCSCFGPAVGCGLMVDSSDPLEISNIRVVTSGFSAGTNATFGCPTIGSCCTSYNGTFDFSSTDAMSGCGGTSGCLGTGACNANFLTVGCCAFEMVVASSVACTTVAGNFNADIVIRVGFGGATNKSWIVEFYAAILTGGYSGLSLAYFQYYDPSINLTTAAAAKGSFTIPFMAGCFDYPNYNSTCQHPSTLSLVVT